MAGMHPLKVMTYNMANYDDHGDWVARRALFVSLIVAEQPDVILFQACSALPLRENFLPLVNRVNDRPFDRYAHLLHTY